MLVCAWKRARDVVRASDGQRRWRPRDRFGVLVLHPGVFVATLKSMNHDNCLTEQIVSNKCVPSGIMKYQIVNVEFYLYTSN